MTASASSSAVASSVSAPSPSWPASSTTAGCSSSASIPARLPRNSPTAVGAVPGVSHVEVDGPGRWMINASRDVHAELLAAVGSAGGTIDHFVRRGADLDAIYHRYFTGRTDDSDRRVGSLRHAASTRRWSSNACTAAGGSSPARSSSTTSTRFASSSLSCSSPWPGWPRCTRPAARSATPPARRPTCRRSSSTCSRWRPIGCRRSTSSSPSSARCSASPSASTPSTASARSAPCRAWSPSRSTATR